jgi:competence protein ComEC
LIFCRGLRAALKEGIRFGGSAVLTFVSFLLGTALYFLFPFFPVLGSLLFLSAAVFSLSRGRFIFVPIMIIGILCAAFRYSPPVDSLDVWNREMRLSGRFLQGHGRLGQIQPAVFEIEAASDPVSGREIEGLRGREAEVFPDGNVDYNGHYEIMLSTTNNRERLDPGVMRGSRLYGRITAVLSEGDVSSSLSGRFDRYRALINGYVAGRFREEPAALISAVTTGDTSSVSQDLRNVFNVTGLAHMLSISGTHFGLFSVMIFAACLFLIKRLPYPLLQRVTIYLTPRQAAAVLCLPCMAIYLGISGAGPPAMRAFVMIGLFLAGLLLGRTGFWLNSLLLAATFLVLRDPGVLLTLSFQLSFLAVLFIGFAADNRGEITEGEKPLPRYLRKALLLTLSATAGTAALAAYHFHYLSLVSPLSNLIIAPFMGFVLVPSAVFSSLSFLATGRYLLAPLVSFSADVSIALVRLFARIPLADVKIHAFPPAVCIFFYAGCLAYFLLGRKKKLLLLPVLPIFLYALSHAFEKKELTVTFLDVGQGDSEVIELPDRRTIVVDTGRTGRETTAFLRFIGKKQIDALVLSHSHPDHSGGLPYIFSAFTVGEVWDNGRILYPAGLHMTALHRALKRGDKTEARDCSITVLHPYREFYTSSGDDYDGENDSSLVLSVAGRRMSVLLAGDVEDEAEEDMVHLGAALRSDVIKIPHHGGRSSAKDEFLTLVSPSIAVISVGRDNTFGHPSPEALEKLAGIRVFRTDRDGAVQIRETADGPAVRTYAEFGLRKANSLSAEWANIRKLFVSW